jgi:hypothetical protein
MRGNCLVFALRLWWRRPEGYVAIRRGHHFTGIPHFIWVDTARRHWVSFCPDPAHVARLQAMHPLNPLRYLHTLWFDGSVRWGDR